MVHAFKPCIQEAETGRSPGQHYFEIIFKSKQINKQNLEHIQIKGPQRWLMRKISG